MNNKILASVLVIGVALMMGIGGGIAYFHDSEETSGFFEAGSLELVVDEWAGEWSEGADCYWDGENFTVEDVKPGDSGWGSVTFKIEDNPAWGRVVIDNIEGELGDMLDFTATLYNKDGEEEVCSTDFELLEDMDNVILGPQNLENCKWYTLTIEVEWPTGQEDVNTYQGATLDFDMNFEIVQKRHNDDPIVWE